MVIKVSNKIEKLEKILNEKIIKEQKVNNKFKKELNHVWKDELVGNLKFKIMSSDNKLKIYSEVLNLIQHL